MANELALMDIDSIYSISLKTINVKKSDPVPPGISLEKLTDLFESEKVRHKHLLLSAESVRDNLLEQRKLYFDQLKHALKFDSDAIYGNLDIEIEKTTIDAKDKKNDKAKLIENQLRIASEFRDSQLELKLIIKKTIEIERKKISEGKSTWKNIETFIKEMKKETMTSMEERRTREILPIMPEIAKYKEDIKKIESEMKANSELISLKYAEKIFNLNKEARREELRILDLHLRAMSYFETQLQISSSNVQDVLFEVDKAMLFEGKKDNERKRQILYDNEELINKFTSSVHDELEELNVVESKFDNVGNLQEEMKLLASNAQEKILGDDDKTIEAIKILENMVSESEKD